MLHTLKVFLCSQGLIILNLEALFFEYQSFNTNISHQLFDYKITLWINNTRTQIQKMILYSKPGFRCSFKRFLNPINTHYTHNTNCQPLIIINCIRPTKPESKICIINSDVFRKVWWVPWRIIAALIFQFQGNNILIIIYLIRIPNRIP